MTTDASPSIYIVPAELPYAFGTPRVTASLKAELEDFRVQETLGFSLEGEGQHVWLHIEKKDLTTEHVAKTLAKIARVKSREIGYAGLKDRHAVTRQWFSVDMGRKDDLPWQVLLPANCRLIKSMRHTKKLRRGVLKGNTFDITLRGVSGNIDEFEERAALIRKHGAPNYFGEQRFGEQGANVDPAYRLLRGELVIRNRFRRGIYYSCARALLFNRVLARRVVLSNWHCPIAGDVMMLEGSRSRFTVTIPDSELVQRGSSLDIHPSGPLWGKRESSPSGEAGRIENEVLRDYGDWLKGLETADLEYDRRPLRVAVGDFHHQLIGNDQIKVRFSLPAGAYATMVLRELVRTSTKRRVLQYHRPRGVPS